MRDKTKEAQEPPWLHLSSWRLPNLRLADSQLKTLNVQTTRGALVQSEPRDKTLSQFSSAGGTRYQKPAARDAEVSSPPSEFASVPWPWA